MSQLESECLKLNKNWSPIAVISVRQAFLDAAAGAVTLLKFHEGYPTIYRLEDWLRIEPREGEDVVTISAKYHETRQVCVPRVVICVNYDKLLLKSVPCTPDNLLRRYGNKDAVTGKKLRRESFSREHVTPRSHGGRSGWENEVPMDRKLNSRRGNRSYQEVGLSQPRVLGAPKPLLPINMIRNKHGYKEWEYFHIPK